MDFLQRLVCALDALHAPTVAELNEVLRRTECDKDHIQPYVTDPLPGMAYGRNVVYRSQDVEAIIVHLPAGARTSIHNHGDSIGCVRVIEGQMGNVMYRAEGFGLANEIGTVYVAAGSCCAAPHGQIHQMRNVGEDRMVSLHLYSPPLQGMRTFRPEKEAVLDFVI